MASMTSGPDPRREAKYRTGQTKDLMRPGWVTYEDGSHEYVRPLPDKNNPTRDGIPIRRGGAMSAGLAAALRIGGRSVGGSANHNVDRYGRHPEGPHIDVHDDGTEELLEPPPAKGVLPPNYARPPRGWEFPNGSTAGRPAHVLEIRTTPSRNVEDHRRKRGIGAAIRRLGER